MVPSSQHHRHHRHRDSEWVPFRPSHAAARASLTVVHTETFDEFAKVIIADNPGNKALADCYDEVYDPHSHHVVYEGNLNVSVTASAGGQPGQVIFSIGKVTGVGTNTTDKFGFGHFTGKLFGLESDMQGGKFSLTIIGGANPKAFLNLLTRDNTPLPQSPWQSTSGTQNGTVSTWYGTWE